MRFTWPDGRSLTARECKRDQSLCSSGSLIQWGRCNLARATNPPTITEG